MKLKQFKEAKDRADYQESLDRLNHLEGELKQIQQQIQDFQTNYFEKSWVDGNILIGWSKNSSPQNVNHVKIRLFPHDKVFSLSSTTSPINLDIKNISDRNISQISESRFQSIKKKRIKKRRCIEPKKRSARRHKK